MRFAIFTLVFSALSLPILSATTLASDARFKDLETYLEDVHQNPAKMMQELPRAVLHDGTTISRGKIEPYVFKPYGDRHQELRDWVVNNSKTFPQAPQFARTAMIPFSAPVEGDSAKDLVYSEKLIVNIDQQFKEGLFKGGTEFVPWSDSYWPMYRGILGARYADEGFPNSKDWAINYRYVQSNPAFLFSSQNPSLLSPSEKYDLLVGDSNWTLTNHNWNSGKKSYEANNGIVAPWQGICHGWAAAIHMGVLKPQKPVTVTAANGQKIKFDISDIKSLQSYLWANSSPKTRFVGSRCRVTNPPRDEVGRVIDQGCFDSNPATWHNSIVNQVGKIGRSLVMDSTFDTEVWNYAVYNYNTIFFNPQTRKPSSNPRASAIPLAQFRSDLFGKYRSPKAKYVVGVAMDVTYPGAAEPRRGLHGKEPLVTSVIRYVYDLELDEKLNVVGGEWYSNAHPDFIWTFEPDGVATTIADQRLSPEIQWDINQVMPAEWRSAALEQSQRGRILSSIANDILAASQTAAPEEEEVPSDPAIPEGGAETTAP